MERKEPFLEDEIYHVYTRGVDKRIVFNTDQDKTRFMLTLLACNRKEPVRMDNLLRSEQGEPLLKIPNAESLVNIVAYALMPNHIHMLIQEKRVGGISKFMLKLMTAYSMYFNTKYERSGPLFTRPFRSRHIDSDEYFRWVFSYISLNPLELFQRDWETVGLNDVPAGKNFMRAYRYGSFVDYFADERPESRILNKQSLLSRTETLTNLDDLLRIMSDTNPRYLESPTLSAAAPQTLL